MPLSEQVCTSAYPEHPPASTLVFSFSFSCLIGLSRLCIRGEGCNRDQDDAGDSAEDRGQGGPALLAGTLCLRRCGRLRLLCRLRGGCTSSNSLGSNLAGRRLQEHAAQADACIMDVPPRGISKFCHVTLACPCSSCETSFHSAARLQKSERQVLTRAEEACQGVVVRLGRVQAGELLFHGCHVEQAPPPSLAQGASLAPGSTAC